jgi:hypothetical protein
MPLSRHHFLFHFAALCAAATLCLPQKAAAVLFYETADASYNTSAPTGFYENSGWQYQGYFGSFLGTMISPYHFLTSKHGSTATTFVYDSVFSGQETINYNVDTTVNEGLGYWDIPGTDIRMFQVTSEFSQYAPLYTRTNEVGKPMVIIGRGGARGSEVQLAPDGLKGWATQGSDGTARWGRNTIDSVQLSLVGELLVSDFDAVTGQDEAHISSGDSGGAVFINDGGTWKLAGINYGVEGLWDTNTINDGSQFSAALFDKGGFYKGTDSTGWTFQPNNFLNRPSELYVSRISSSASYINNLVATVPIPVPEPGGAFMVMTTGLAWLLRRRK